MYSKSFDITDSDVLEKTLGYIRNTLSLKKISKSTIIKTELLAEETIVLLIKHGVKGEKITVKISNFLGDVSIELKLRGEQFEPNLNTGDELDANEDAIRSILLNAYGEKYKYSHRNNVNRVRIIVEKGERNALYLTLIAMILGIVCGLCLTNFVPTPVENVISTYFLRPIKTMFMSAIRIIIAPVIFFSLVSCISQFKSLTDLGRMAAKVMGVYTFTTLVATVLGFGVATVLKPGEWGFALNGASNVENFVVENKTRASVLDTIVDIVPSNLLKPFVEANTLQIMFLAILIGIAVGMIGEYSAVLKEIFEACNSLFLTITTIISKAIPIASFCSVSLMITELGGGSVKSVLAAGAVEIFTIVLMICIYGLLILLVAHLNPIKFFSNIREGMLTSFTLASSSASIPINMRICRDKLGIEPKLYNFSIPLGATVNMDGMCIYMTSFAIFFARAYGIEISYSAMLSSVLVIVLLSLASPGVPGVAILNMGIVLSQFGVPIEAIGLILVINPIIDMADTVNNITGDLTATVLVAKSEKLIDVEKYNA